MKDNQEKDKHKDTNHIDWSLTTWEGSRREQLRRWAELPLEAIVAAQEEMEQLAQLFQQTREKPAPDEPGNK